MTERDKESEHRSEKNLSHTVLTRPEIHPSIQSASQETIGCLFNLNTKEFTVTSAETRWRASFTHGYKEINLGPATEASIFFPRVH